MIARWSMLTASLLLAAGATSPADSQPASGPLVPNEVVRSVDRFLPAVEQARRDVEAAGGDLTAARGGFDLTVSASGQRLDGAYDNTRFSSLFEQPLATWGASVFGGYRTGRGSFAPYDSKAETADSGEVVAGVAVPLLRGRTIDRRRAEREAASLGVQRAGGQLAAVRLGAFTAALGRYWDWVAAGRQLDIARALLALAEARDQQLADAVALGQVAQIERTDNQRAILQRRSALVVAQRLLEQRAIDLSLYYRGADAAPLRPDITRLPALPGAEALDIPAEADAVRAALDRRPEILARRLRRDQAQVDLRLAENTRLPSLDFLSEVTRETVERGKANDSGGDLELGLSFTLPLQRRKAIGQSVKARAAVGRADLDVRWAEDTVRAEVQDALSAVRAAAGVLEAVAQEVAVARELERLERDRFDLGDSTQFLVNLRELATADAEVREARARVDVQKAVVALDAATGRLLDRVPTP